MQLSRLDFLVGTCGILAGGCREKDSPSGAMAARVHSDTSRARAEPLYLYPERSPYDRGFDDDAYALLVNRILLRDTSTPCCQLVVEPAFRNEHAVFIAWRGTSCKLVLREAFERLRSLLCWRVQAGLPPAMAAQRVNDAVQESSRAIPRGLGSLLEQCWMDMLLRTSPRPAPRFIPDATGYHFSHEHLAGQICSPPQETVARAFVDLGAQMTRTARALRADFERAANDLDECARGFLATLKGR